MKILLFGGSGQLGFELKKRAADLDFELVSPVTKELDITERDQVISLITTLRPTTVINSAAYTAVDRAEEEQERAFAINADGARNIAEGCQQSGARLIHISTDYVFDGASGRALAESDVTRPLSVYGRSKLAGEEYVRELVGDRGVIVRTQALYGKKGINFVHTMLKLFGEREVLKIVNDQYVSPTWAGWLSEVLLDLVRLPVSGTLHASCEGFVSWFDFAVEIQRLAAPSFEGRPLAKLEPTTAAELNRPATRPAFSAFDTTRLESVLGRPAMEWRTALEIFLSEIGFR